MRKRWRKREGIEPPGDIAASRPDLKSGRATSALSASIRSLARLAGKPALLLRGLARALLPGLLPPVPPAPDLPLPFRGHLHLVPIPICDAGTVYQKGKEFR